MNTKNLLIELCEHLEKELNRKYRGQVHKVELISGLKPYDHFMADTSLINKYMAWNVEIWIDGKCVFIESHIPKENEQHEVIEDFLMSRTLRHIFTFVVMLVNDFVGKVEIVNLKNTRNNIPQNAIWWIGNGDVGLSSKTIWNCLVGNKDIEIHHPHDPDDFNRCYELLEAVPEWKSELYKLKSLSTQWSNIVDSWGLLTKMLEEDGKNNWLEMYKFMQTLTTKKLNKIHRVTFTK